MHKEEKISELAELLKTLNCKEADRINDLVKSILDSADDKTTFFGKAFFDKTSDRNIMFQAEQLDIHNVKSRVLLLEFEINIKEQTFEILNSIVSSRMGQNYIVPIVNNKYAIVYDIDSEDDASEFSLAMSESMINEFGAVLNVGVGGEYKEIADCKRSYEEAEMALNAGKKILGDSIVYEYDNIAIAKLIFDLSQSESERFLKEVFNEESLKELENREMLESLNTFFKCDLNLSVAARELYIHRNTLVYRIEKFNKASGYNLCKFEDAVIVKIALLFRRKMNDKI